MPTTTKNIISCRNSAYPTLEEALRMLPDAGIRHVELSEVASEDLANVQKLAHQCGITIATVGYNLNLSDKKSVDDLYALLAAVANVGVKRVFSSVGADSVADRKDVMGRLAKAAQKAADLKVVICMETHRPFGHNAQEAVRTVKEIDSPGLRINFDTANIYYYNRDCTAVEELQRAASFVGSVHLKDTDGGYESGNFPVLGQGVVDFPEVFRILGAAGIHDPLTLELEGPLTQGKSLTERHNAVKACTEYLRSIGVA